MGGRQTANTKILGHLTANSKIFAVTFEINKRIKIYTKIEKMAFFRMFNNCNFISDITSVVSVIYFSFFI